MKKVRLSSIAAVNAGGTPSRSNLSYWNGDIPWVKISDIQGKHVQTYEEAITDEGLKNSSAKLFYKGTILYTIFATLGRVGILDFDATTNQAIAGINILDETIDCDYLYYFLRSQEKKAKAIGKGAAQQNINLKILRDWLVPIRSKEEQTNIVGSLEKIESAISAKTELLNSLDSLVKSRFMETFGTPGVNENSYPVKSIGELATEINYGTSKPAMENGDIPYLRMGNMTDSGSLDFSDMKYIHLEGKEYEKAVVRDGDFLFNRTNSRDHVGRSCVYHGDHESIIAGYIVRVRLNKALITADYLAQFMNTPQMKLKLKSMARGAVNQANINATEMSSIEVFVPPINLQQAFISFVELIDKSRFVCHSRYFL